MRFLWLSLLACLCAPSNRKRKECLPRSQSRGYTQLGFDSLEDRVLLNAVPVGNYSGILATNTEFLDTSGTYVINGNLTIPSGVTLTIGSGAKVQINNGGDDHGQWHAEH